MATNDWPGLVMLALLFVLLAVMVSDGIKTQRIYRRMAEQERAERARRNAALPICADTGAPKWPGNCWNVRCQLGGTCCRSAGEPQHTKGTDE